MLKTLFHTTILLFALIGFTACGSKQLYDTAVEYQRSSAGMQKKSINLDFGKIVYLENDKKSDTTIVLVHGFGGNKDNWTKVVAEWHDRYHVIAIDLPGNGESVSDKDLDYTTTHQAQMLNDFIKAKGLKHFHLIGHSMGGAIALRYMEHYAKDVCSLVLIDAMGMEKTKSDGVKLVEVSEKNPLYDVCTQERIETLIDYSMHKPPAFFDTFKQVLLKEKCHRKEIEKVMYEDLYKDVDLSNVAKRLQTPTLIVWGEKDRMTHVDNAILFHNTIKRSQLVILKEVGHVPLLEDPVRTADEVDKFIKQIER
jgi:pimeloyl-ACP methyl ester carboxylesterase